MQSPIWSPASFCHPATSWRRCPPPGLRAQRHHPDGPGPTLFSPSPLTDATGQAQPQDSSGLHLLLPVPVGAARFGVPILYLFWVPPPFFFWMEREHRSDFLGKRQDTENPGRGCSHQPWWIRLSVSHYPGDSGQVAPVKPTHSRALVMAGRGDRP